MTGRERIRCSLMHEEPDQVPIHDTLWPTTVKRWQNEGIPEDVLVSDFFGYEMVRVMTEQGPMYKKIIICEDEEYVTYKDSNGETIRNHKDYTSSPQEIDNHVKSKKDWEELKERLTIGKERLITYRDYKPGDPLLISSFSWEETIKEFKKDCQKGRANFFWAIIGFDMVNHYLGYEKLLEIMLTDPQWAKEMFDTQAAFTLRLYEYFTENGLKFDGAFLANDMGYRNGLLFSPRCYRELIFPSDKLICDYFHSLGMPVILHCDGNIKELIPHLIEAGFDCLEPLEVKAGMDIRELKKEYGDKLSFMGGIDVRLMSDDSNKIEEEIRSKFEIAKKGGGYIYHSDHTIPHNISLSQYKHVMELVKKYGSYKHG